MDLRRLRRLLDLLVGRVGLREAEVLAHGRVEEIGLLRDDADGGGERLEREVADVDAVDPHRALGRVVEARDEVAERRLAGAGLADDRRRRPRRDRELDALERPGRRRRSGTRRRRSARRRCTALERPRARRDVDRADRGTRRCGRRARASSGCRPRSLSRLPIGAKSRVCRVVKATSVPIVEYGAGPRRCATARPPKR